MSDIEPKEALIGLLIIGLVAMAGWIGFLYVNPITKMKTDEDEINIYSTITVLRDYKTGLPDDWSNAPLTSSITLYNETGDPVIITLKQILEYVEKWEETNEEVDPSKKDWWEKRLEPITIQNANGIPITGVDILEVLRVFDCNFAGGLKFESNDPDVTDLDMEVVDMCNIIDTDDSGFVLGLAVDKKWLRYSPIADENKGDFLIYGKEVTIIDEDYTNMTEIVEYQCYNITTVTVTKNWTIDVNIFNSDGSPNQTLTLDAFNITKAYNAPVPYEYENTAWWYFNATYQGTNISQIVEYTKAKGTDYLLNITFSPGDCQPADANYKNKRGLFSDADYFNWTDVEDHIAHNGTHTVGDHVDYVNWTLPASKPYRDHMEATGAHMPASNLKMCITNKIQYFYSYFDDPTDGDPGEYNDPWGGFYNDGYPPFKLIIPGLGQPRYFNGIVEINIKILSNSR